jgi:hypothetical protein
MQPGSSSSPSAPTAPHASPPDTGRTAVAVVLIAVGLLALAGTLGWLPSSGGVVGALTFAAVGAGLVWLARRYANDWLMFAAFPAFGLAFASAVPGNLGGAGFLAGTGAGFLALVVAEPKRWWAVIPTGVLFTLAILAWASGAMGEPLGGTVFFLGLAVTFGVVWRATASPQAWAVFPAAGCLAMALIVGLAQADWIVPVALIAIGAALLLRDRLRHQRG